MFALAVSGPFAVILAPIFCIYGLDTRRVWYADDGTVWEARSNGVRLKGRVDVRMFGKGEPYRATASPTASVSPGVGVDTVEIAPAEKCRSPPQLTQQPPAGSSVHAPAPALVPAPAPAAAPAAALTPWK